MWYREAKSKYTTAIIALRLNKKDAKQLLSEKNKWPAGMELESVNNLHITLIYLGETKKIESKKPVIELLLKTFAEKQKPIVGKIGGVGCFKGTPKSGKPFYASYDSPDLPSFREELVGLLDSIGIQADKTHGFTPHISLSFLPYDIETVISSVPNIEVEFDSISLMWCGEKINYKLKGN